MSTPSLNHLRDAIHAIGEKMTADSSYADYPDLEYNPDEGILPRGLILEETGRPEHAIGSVIVGLNPGKASLHEKAALRTNATYADVIAYWQEHVLNHLYYKRLRALTDTLSLSGPILWTELVKCQSVQNGNLSVATIRDDVNRYLFAEIQEVPSSWPLIGVGRQAYSVLAYRFPDRMVLGVPHATGSFGFFTRLYKDGVFDHAIATRAHHHIRDSDTVAVWLPDLGIKH